MWENSLMTFVSLSNWVHSCIKYWMKVYVSKSSIVCPRIWFWEPCFLLGFGGNQIWVRVERLWNAAKAYCQHAFSGRIVQLWTCGFICYFWYSIPDTGFWSWDSRGKIVTSLVTICFGKFNHIWQMLAWSELAHCWPRQWLHAMPCVQKCNFSYHDVTSSTLSGSC